MLSDEDSPEKARILAVDVLVSFTGAGAGGGLLRQ